MALKNRKNVFCTMEPETKKRLDDFIKDQEIKPNITVVIETAVKLYLTGKGY